MERITYVSELRQNVEALLRDVSETGDTMVIEHEDEPKAVLVPVRVYLQWKENQAMLADLKRKRAEQDGISEAEVEANDLIEEAKWWIRLKDKAGSGGEITN
jgi:PHD/YefM family antitoxin component YafN of YafNO toxin-antitoxin module